VDETTINNGSSTIIHHHHHHGHGGHIFINCGGNWGLQWLFKQKGQASWLKKLFEKKNNEEWLANLLEKKEIDSEQHTFLKDLLAKRDQEEKSSGETNAWWKNLFEKKFDGHKPYWAKDGQQETDMNWKWSHGHSWSASHSHSTSHTKTWSSSSTKKYVQKFGHEDDSESSSGSEDMPNPLVSQSKGPLRPLVAQNPSLRGGNDDSESSSDSNDLMI